MRLEVHLDMDSHIIVMAAWETRNVLSRGFLTSVDQYHPTRNFKRYYQSNC